MHARVTVRTAYCILHSGLLTVIPRRKLLG